MERLLKLLLTILMMSSMVIIGCLEDSPTAANDDDKLVGTWEMASYTINGDAQDIEEGFVIVFKADGTGVFSVLGMGSEQFEWSTEGDSLSLIVEGDTETVTFSVTSTTLIIQFEDEDGLNVQTFTKREDNDNGDHDPDVIGMWNIIGRTVDGENASYEETIYVYYADGSGAYSSGTFSGTFQWSTDGNKLSITENGTTVYTYSVTSTTMIREIDIEGEHWVETFEKVTFNLAITGTWDLTAYSVNGIDDPSFEGLSDWTYVFNDDGTGTFTENGETANIEWSISGSQITIQRRDVSRVMTWGLSQTEYPDGRVITNLDFTYDEEENHIIETYTARSSDPDSPTTVHGWVRDAETRDLLSDVEISSSDGNSTTTGFDGTYSMIVGSGLITLSASKSGYSGATTDIETSGEENLEVNFALVRLVDD